MRKELGFYVTVLQWKWKHWATHNIIGQGQSPGYTNSFYEQKKKAKASKEQNQTLKHTPIKVHKHIQQIRQLAAERGLSLWWNGIIQFSHYSPNRTPRMPMSSCPKMRNWFHAWATVIRKEREKAKERIRGRRKQKKRKMFLCVCMCVCVQKRKREREKERWKMRRKM